MINYLELEKKLIVEIKLVEKRKSSLTKDYQNSIYFIYNSRLPEVKKINFDEFEELNQNKKLEILIELIKNTNISEVVSWSLNKIGEFDINFLIENKKDLLLIAYNIENWWHADDLSKIYAKILDKHKLLLKDFQNWAKIGGHWQKRLSLTSLLYYSSQRKNPLQSTSILSQIKILLEEKNHYIQKGLGWTLRECYNLYPEETLEFMKIYAKKISSTAFSQAIEKLNDENKNYLKYLRKKEVSNPHYFEK